MIIPSLENKIAKIGFKEEHYIETYSHCLNLEKMAQIVFQDSRLKELYTDKQIQAILTGVRYHDIGKAQIDPHILYSSKRLSNEEKETHINPHPITGAEILKENVAEILLHLNGRQVLSAVEIQEALDGKNDDFNIILNVCQWHQRGIDGTGYPKVKDELPLYVEMVAVLDFFEALTADRCYSPSKPTNVALDIIEKDYLKEDGTGRRFSDLTLTILKDYAIKLKPFINVKVEVDKSVNEKLCIVKDLLVDATRRSTEMKSHQPRCKDYIKE